MESHINIQTVSDILFQAQFPTWTLPCTKDANELWMSVQHTHSTKYHLLILMLRFCNIIRIGYICQCLNKMRAAFGTNCETDYINYISPWEKLLKFKMLQLTERQEISWGISASRNLIAQLKNWSVSRCSMKSALINSVKTLQESKSCKTKTKSCEENSL